MRDSMKANFENSRDVMPKHIGHKSVCIFAVTHIE